MNATLNKDVQVSLSAETDGHGDMFHVVVTVSPEIAEQYDVAGETQGDGRVVPWNGSFTTGWVSDGTEDVGTLERMFALYVELSVQRGRTFSEVFTALSWVTGRNDLSLLLSEFDRNGTQLL